MSVIFFIESLQKCLNFLNFYYWNLTLSWRAVEAEFIKQRSTFALKPILTDSCNYSLSCFSCKEWNKVKYKQALGKQSSLIE